MGTIRKNIGLGDSSGIFYKHADHPGTRLDGVKHPNKAKVQWSQSRELKILLL